MRSGGATGIVVKTPLSTETKSFVMNNQGPIRSIKFSSDSKILAIQRAENSVEFINFVNNEPVVADMMIHKCTGIFCLVVDSHNVSFFFRSFNNLWFRVGCTEGSCPFW